MPVNDVIIAVEYFTSIRAGKGYLYHLRRICAEGILKNGLEAVVLNYILAVLLVILEQRQC